MLKSPCIPLLTLMAFFLISCGGGSSGIGRASAQRVAIVVLENQDYGSVVGSSAMPFLNSLIQKGSLATQFFANLHPSIGNYFLMTTGQVVTTDDSFNGSFSGDNVTLSLDAAGKTWKVYAQSLPSTGYVGGDQYPFIQHHEPFGYFENVRDDPSQRNNIVPIGQLATDTNQNTLPDYSFIVPDNLHNGHDCPTGGLACPLADRLSTIDAWLQSNIGPLLAGSGFANNAVLVITFDESASDNTFGGGRIATVLAGGAVKSGFQSTTMYQFPSLLRFSLKVLGVTAYPGEASQAPDM